METAVSWLMLMREFLAALAALLAVVGISTWRAAFLGKRRIELAEETLSLFYQARDAISAMRGPAAWGSETDNISRFTNDSDERYHWRQTVTPLLRRYQARSELFGRLQATKYQFMSRFGLDEAKPFDDMRSTVNGLLTNATLLVDFADFNDDETNRLRREMTASIWDQGQRDQIRPEVDRIVAAIELICRPIIASEGWFLRKRRRFGEWWTEPVGSGRREPKPGE